MTNKRCHLCHEKLKKGEGKIVGKLEALHGTIVFWEHKDTSKCRLFEE